MNILHHPADLLPLILNHASLKSVSDFKKIRAVCRCFNEHKTVQSLKAQHTGTNTIFSFVHDKKVECLALPGDLAGITVPGSLPGSLNVLDLTRAENIPADLITKARALPHCYVITD